MKSAVKKKKNIAVLTLLAMGMVFSYLSVISCVSGFLVAKYLGGKEEGMRGKMRSIVIPMGRIRFHLHHWLVCVVMIAIGLSRTVYIVFPPEVYYGLLGGIAWQGVYCYSDWRKIIHRHSSSV